MAKLFANSGHPDRMSRSATSDLGLHSLPITLLGVTRLKGINKIHYFINASSQGEGQTTPRDKVVIITGRYYYFHEGCKLS